MKDFWTIVIAIIVAHVIIYGFQLITSLIAWHMGLNWLTEMMMILNH